MESSGMKVGFDKFDRKGSFTMWKVRVEDLLVQIGLNSALKNKLEGMTVDVLGENGMCYD